MSKAIKETTETTQIADKKYLVPFVLITSLFFLWGFARAILDVLNKHFQNALHISITLFAHSGNHLSGLFPHGDTGGYIYK